MHSQELPFPSPPAPISRRTPDEAEHWREFGRWLRARRKEHTLRTGSPRARIARQAGVSDNTWANWERGGRNAGGHWVTYRPTPAHLDAAAAVLGIPPAEIRLRSAFGPPAASLPPPSATVPSPDPVHHLTVTLTPFDPTPLYDRITALEARLDALHH